MKAHLQTSAVMAVIFGVIMGLIYYPKEILSCALVFGCVGLAVCLYKAIFEIIKPK